MLSPQSFTENQLPGMPIDRYEQHRRGIEDYIQQDLPQFQGSEDDNYSVENFRHGPSHSPLPFDPYISFARSVQNEFDFAPPPENQSYYRPSRKQTFSYRSDDESYAAGGETMSTMGHHRSVVTLRTGLVGGQPGSPRSEKEYDPERQVDRLINHVPHMSMFAEDSPQSRTARNDDFGRHGRQQPSSSKPRDKSQVHRFYEPVIVDDPAAIDRAVETGHFQLHNPPPIPQARSLRDHTRDDNNLSPPESRSASTSLRSDPPTPPKPKFSDAFERVADESFDAHAKKRPFSPLNSPRLRSRPTSSMIPEPSMRAQSSGFAERAKDLGQQIDEGMRAAPEVVQTPRRRYGRATGPQRTPAKVFLPDVTGLTSAMGSPNKSRLAYLAAAAEYLHPEVKDIDAAIEDLEARLRDGQRVNTTSRRRVRELEIELQNCQRGVDEGRTLLEAQRERSRVEPADKKGKRREAALPSGEDVRAWEQKYSALVEERNLLEKLVYSLMERNAHIQAQLEQRQQEIEQLRLVHEQDQEELTRKEDEIAENRRIIDGLIADVQHLRAVVEEGIRDRRRRNESSESFNRTNGDLSTVQEATNEDEEDHSRPHPLRYEGTPPAQDDACDTDTDYYAGQDVTRPHIEVHDATLEYTQGDITVQPLEDADAFAKPAQQPIEMPIRSSSRMSTRAPSPGFGVGRPPSRLSTRADGDDEAATTSSLGKPVPAEYRRFRAMSDVPETDEERYSQAGGTDVDQDMDPDMDVSRASSDPGPANHRRKASHHRQPPVPRLRSAHAERLFHDPTNHDVNKCRKCRRDRRDREVLDVDATQWLQDHLDRRAMLAEEGDGDWESQRPPEKLLIQVVRELEDDFAHYKSLYVEAAEQYALMDTLSSMAKRNILAEHLKDLINCLESKADQVYTMTMLFWPAHGQTV